VVQPHHQQHLPHKNIMDNKNIIKERLEQLPEPLRIFVVEENWRGEAEKIGKQFNLDEKNYASLEDEIFFVLLCFEPKTNFVENIKIELELDQSIAEEISEEINKKIFSNIVKELDEIWKTRNLEKDENKHNAIAKQTVGEREEKQNQNPEPKKENRSNVAQSFEQIILNQAKAMQPAVAKDTIGYGAAKPTVAEQRRKVPVNLPTGEQNQNEPKKVHDYPPDNDPYRESIQ
jgi:hypothetical protein